MSGVLNRWAYCANDPVNASDPTGRYLQLVGAVLFLVGLGMVIGSMFTSGQDSTVLAGVGGILMAVGALLLGNVAGFAAAMTQLGRLASVVGRLIAAMILWVLRILGVDIYDSCTRYSPSALNSIRQFLDFLKSVSAEDRQRDMLPVVSPTPLQHRVFAAVLDGRGRTYAFA
jgi:hypothetical protein